MVEGLDGISVDLMSGVWTPDPHKILIFGSEVRNDIALSLTPPLSANKHVNQSVYAAWIEAESGNCSYKHVPLRASLCRHEYVCRLG
jgi:hypothetical protein